MISSLQFLVNPFQENTYLWYNEAGEAAIVDPGFYTTEEENKFKEELVRRELKLTRCLLTHAHLDHIFGCAFIHEVFGLHPEMHPRSEKVYKKAYASAEMYGVRMKALPDPVYNFGQDGLCDILGVQFRILHIPGHSPGSIGFYLAEQSEIWAGDVLFQGSIGRTDLPGGDFKTLEQSIRDKLYVLPDETIVHSGHGPDTTIGFEKQNNPFVFVS